MSPATAALVISLVEELIKEEPAIAAEVQTIFSKPDATPADWEALRVKVLAKNYSDFVPQSALSGAPVSQ